MKQTAHIEDWKIIEHPMRGKCLEGLISEHPNPFANSWREWDRSLTSTLLSIDLKNNRAETRNTFYTLGTPAQEQSCSDAKSSSN